MKLIILKRNLLIKLFIVCISIVSVYQLNLPSDKWQDGDKWQIRVYQRADHMMSYDPRWLVVNELNMDLRRQDNGKTAWSLHVSDTNNNELFPGIKGLLIYYSDDFKVVDGYGFDESNQKVMHIDEFFSLSLFGTEFFLYELKKYHSLGLLLVDQVNIKLCEEKGRTASWDENHTWWVSYESKSPPLKAEVITQN